LKEDQQKRFTSVLQNFGGEEEREEVRSLPIKLIKLPQSYQDPPPPPKQTFLKKKGREVTRKETRKLVIGYQG